jgi:hypothetical protein
VRRSSSFDAEDVQEPENDPPVIVSNRYRGYPQAYYK